jgi:thiamine kinase-like enzyme
LCLPWATINANTVEEGRQIVRQQLAQLPAGAEPDGLLGLVRSLEAADCPQWPTAPVRLCRLDNNIANYLQRPGQWVSVDWEYSGWGDPAFDMANMMTHVAYLDVPASRWTWVLDTYCDLVDDGTAALRIPIYCTVPTVWWVARLARYLRVLLSF